MYNHAVSLLINTLLHLLSIRFYQIFQQLASRFSSFLKNLNMFSFCIFYSHRFVLHRNNRKLTSVILIRYQLPAPDMLLTASQFIFQVLPHLTEGKNHYVFFCFLIALFLVKKSPWFIKVLHMERGEGCCVSGINQQPSSPRLTVNVLKYL